MKEVSVKKFPTIVGELIKENKISVYSLDNLDKTIEGFSYENNIWINWNKNFYIQRFALCHELGHNVLKHRFWDNQEEKEADNFACNLLLDEKELKEKVEEWWMLSDLEITFWIPQCEILKKIKQIYKPENLNFYF